MINETTIKADLYYLSGNIEILESSITDLDIDTSDADEHGYLIQNGTNRCIKHGLGPDGAHYIYMGTNGDPVPLRDDLQEARDWCESMGDAQDDTRDRIRAGADRLLEAVAILSERYEHNESAMEGIEWFADKAREVLASLENEDSETNE